jgi:hypothetical protein
VWIFWYGGIKPSNERDWQRDVAILSYATFNDNLVTLHNIRDIKYKTENDYEVSYYDNVFDINKLNGIDFIATYWMGPSIAHTFLSFSFSDGRHIAISIEARKEKGESFSVLSGFFKENELSFAELQKRSYINPRKIN